VIPSTSFTLNTCASAAAECKASMLPEDGQCMEYRCPAAVWVQGVPALTAPLATNTLKDAPRVMRGIPLTMWSFWRVDAATTRTLRAAHALAGTYRCTRAGCRQSHGLASDCIWTAGDNTWLAGDSTWTAGDSH